MLNREMAPVDFTGFSALICSTDLDILGATCADSGKPAPLQSQLDFSLSLGGQDGTPRSYMLELKMRRHRQKTHRSAGVCMLDIGGKTALN
jgi:hypothetical protein